MPRPPAPIAAALLVTIAATLPAQDHPYAIERGRLASAMQPAIRLEMDTALKYVGTNRWVLYNVAQAEQHLFVQRAGDGIARLLWVQFEEYLPSNTYRYDYSKSTPLSVNGRALRADRDLWTMPATEKRPDSDGAYARRTLREHGFTLPAQMLMERFIYLPDSTNRRELMVIYAESPAYAGAKGTLDATAAKAEVEGMLAALERRAVEAFRIVAK